MTGDFSTWVNSSAVINANLKNSLYFSVVFFLPNEREDLAEERSRGGAPPFGMIGGL